MTQTDRRSEIVLDDVQSFATATDLETMRRASSCEPPGQSAAPATRGQGTF